MESAWPRYWEYYDLLLCFLVSRTNISISCLDAQLYEKQSDFDDVWDINIRKDVYVVENVEQ